MIVQLAFQAIICQIIVTATARGLAALAPLPLVVNYTDVRQWLDDGNTANIFLVGLRGSSGHRGLRGKGYRGSAARGTSGNGGDGVAPGCAPVNTKSSQWRDPCSAHSLAKAGSPALHWSSSPPVLTRAHACAGPPHRRGRRGRRRWTHWRWSASHQSSMWVGASTARAARQGRDPHLPVGFAQGIKLIKLRDEAANVLTARKCWHGC